MPPATPKPIVLLIHGMGTHHQEDNAENAQGGLTSTQKEVCDGVNETAAHFGFEDYRFQDKVELHEFNYSKSLEEILLRDAENSQALIDHITLLQGRGLAQDVAANLVEEFSEADSGKFFYTHWMDVIYYGLMFWGEMIRNELAAKINELYIQANRTGQTVNVIAHSLGTAVLHDTLVKLYRKDADIRAKAPELDVDIFKFDAVIQIANVSRLVNILNGIGDPHTSVVNSGPHKCSKRFFNFFNEFDPFTWFKRWDAPIDTGYSGRITTVRNINTHDLTEYAAAPTVCYAIMRNIVGESISDDTYRLGKQAHYDDERNLKKPLEIIEAEFNKVRNSQDTNDRGLALIRLFRAVQDAMETAKRLRDEF